MDFPLPCIQYTEAKNDPNIVYSALNEFQIFALTDLPSDLNESVIAMFQSFDKFIDSDNTYKEPFCGAPRAQKGLYIDGAVVMGAEGYRYFVTCDTNGTIDQFLPNDHDDQTWRIHSTNIQQYTLEIARFVVAAVNSELHRKNDPLISQYFNQLYVVSSWHRYLPARAGSSGKIEHGDIVTFSTHKDLVPISVLFYSDNQTRGLQGEYGKENQYLDILIPGGSSRMTAIVVTGLLMEYITQNKIQGLLHRVKSKTYNEYVQRRALVNFVNIAPTVVLPDYTSKSTPFTVENYINQFFAERADYLKALNDDLSPGKL